MKSLYARTMHGLFIVTKPFLQVWYRQRPSKRVRVAVRCGNKLLLVRTSFSSQNDLLPGGGIGVNESPLAAAIRELHEETGLRIAAERLHKVGEMQTTQTDMPFHITLFETEVESEMLPKLAPLRQFEIIQRQWVNLDALPNDPVIAWYLNRDSLC